MSSEFFTYLRLGLAHIADLKGYDHILFIVALTAGYAPRDWRRLLSLVTAFTAGHSVTLALATLRLVRVSPPLVELLIAATIVATAGYSLVARLRPATQRSDRGRPERHLVLYGMAGIFGLIHGLGFSSFLRALLGGEEGIVLPLFAFNVGLEVGQLGIVAVVLAVGAVACDVAGLSRRLWAIGVAAATGIAGLQMVADRMPSVTDAGRPPVHTESLQGTARHTRRT